MKVNIYPTVCNLCGGKVEYVSNSKIYGKEYGSGKCYLCTSCGAYVGTHIPRPKEAMGILADKEMRDMKMNCHELFDRKWKTASDKRIARAKAYAVLAEKLGIPVTQCHFGYFDMELLHRAYEILKSEPVKAEKEERYGISMC